MADDRTGERVRLINPRAQPVELHLGSTVHVLAAGQGIELDAASLALPQLAYLLGRKALAVRSVPPPQPPAKAAGAATTPRRRGRKAAAATARPPQPSKRKKGS